MPEHDHRKHEVRVRLTAQEHQQVRRAAAGAVAPFGQNRGKRGPCCGFPVRGSLCGGWQTEAHFTKTKVVTTGATRPRLLRVKGRLHDSV